MENLPQAAMSLPTLLLTYIVSSAASALVFVLVMGAFQYIAYRKFYGKLMKIRKELEQEYGVDKVVAKFTAMAQDDGNKH